MDRLFSKFQLGDIKVGDQPNFPPDAEAQGEQQVEVPTPSPSDDVVTGQRPVAGERTYRPGYGQGLPEKGIEAICLPSLIDLQIDDADRTAIRLVVETR
jgi:hypothetical protein